MKIPVDFRREQLHRPDWYVERDGELYLRASRCSGCGCLIFPTSQVCSRCWPVQPMEEVTLPETARLLSWSVANVGPAKFKPPYSFGYADVTPTVRLFGQLELTRGEPPPQPDSPVRLVLGVVGDDDLGQPLWAYKFATVRRST